MIKNKIFNKIKKVILALFILLTLILLISFTFIQSGKNSDIQDVSKVDTIIVLGAGLWGDKISPQLELRLITAYEILKQNENIIVVVSGGQGPDELISEAKAMKNYLINLGVNGDSIFMEEKSTSTFENLTYSINLLKDNNLSYSKIAVVTTDFHIFRAKMLSSRIGVEVEGKAAPNIDSIIIKNNLREVFALVKDFIFSY